MATGHCPRVFNWLCQGLENQASWEPLLATGSEDGAPAVSPDGAWIAYHSDETGRREVYLQRFPELGDRQQVSTRRAMDPVWSFDGRGLFMRTGTAVPPTEVSFVPVQLEPSVTVGDPDVLFDRQYYRTAGSLRRFDRAPDDRLLMITSGVEQEQYQTIVLVENCYEDLLMRRRA